MLQEIHFVHWFAHGLYFSVICFFFPPNRLVDSYQPQVHILSAHCPKEKRQFFLLLQQQSKEHSPVLNLIIMDCGSNSTTSPSGHMIEKGCWAVL